MHIRFGLLGLLTYQTQVLAADAATVVSPTGSILKMVMGLAVVLAVMALISWGVKRMLPNGTSQQSALKVVGGVSVGSRERVVVLEVSGRWLVVGVAQGQVSAIANLEKDSDQLAETVTNNTVKAHSNAVSDLAGNDANPMVRPFSEWLKKSAQNIKNKG